MEASFGIHLRGQKYAIFRTSPNFLSNISHILFYFIFMKLKIKELRKQKKISQKDLSEKTGISKRMLSDYENGITDVSLSKLQNIASILNCAVSELIGEETPFIQQAHNNISSTINQHQTIHAPEDYETLKKENQRLTQENSGLKDKIIQLMEEKISK